MPSAIQLVLEICGIGAGTGQPMVNIEAGIVDVSNGSLETSTTSFYTLYRSLYWMFLMVIIEAGGSCMFDMWPFWAYPGSFSAAVLRC